MAQKPERICAVETCDRPVRTMDLCNAHYTRKRKFGDVQADIPIRKNPGWHPHAKENADLIQGGLYRCASCNRVKPVRLYYKNKNKPYGIASICKACQNKNNKPYNRRTTLRRYGLDPETYDILRRSSRNRCWICGGGSTKSLTVDHNHHNGNVRGLLCQPCNNILGRWRDNPAIAEAAARYLREDGARVVALLGTQPRGAILKVSSRA